MTKLSKLNIRQVILQMVNKDTCLNAYFYVMFKSHAINSKIVYSLLGKTIT